MAGGRTCERDRRAVATGDGATARSHPAVWAPMLLTIPVGVGEFIVPGLPPEVTAGLGVSVPLPDGW